MLKKKNVKYFITRSLLIIVGFLIFNNLFFLHWHNLENGKVIIHAHPYNKWAERNASETSHEHTQQEIFLIGILNCAILSIFIVSGIYSFSFIPLKIANFIFKEHFHESLFYNDYQARPPPLNSNLKY